MSFGCELGTLLAQAQCLKPYHMLTSLTLDLQSNNVTDMVTPLDVNFRRLGIKDISGKKFGSVFVVQFHRRSWDNSGQYKIEWSCRCDCGSNIILSTDQLRHRKTCGCRINGPPNVVHGKYKHQLYGVWMGMKMRCSNPNSAKFKDYGGRGIKVCKKWQKSFALFLKDMGERPDPSFSIERIDVNGDYCPENCRWDTWSTQCKNQRRWIKNKGNLCHSDQT